MITADWIMLGIIVATLIIGLVVGFGRCLKFFTSGIFGIIISVIVTYFLLGIVNSWQFVVDLLARLNQAMNINPAAANVIDQVILAVIIFAVVQLLRLLAVKVIASLFEVDNGAVKVVNSILGVVAVAFVAVVLGLLTFQIIYWVGGTSAEQVSQALSGSKLGLGWLYENNPLRALVDFFN